MSLQQLIKHINRGVELAGKKSIFGFLTSWEFLKMIQDGNIAHGTMFKGPSGTQVGEDYFGNKYMEDNTLGYTRKRWVVYADKFNYDAASVPPEWHGWLNNITDQVPSKQPYEMPKYTLPARVPDTGIPYKMYNPKGSWLNSQKRNWRKYEVWSPIPEAIKNTQAQILAAGKPSTLPRDDRSV